MKIKNEQDSVFTEPSVNPNAKQANILSIIPAVGMNSMYKGNPEDGSDFLFYPLVCWALIEKNDGTKAVVGMDTSIEGVVSVCNEFEDFIGYVTEQEIKDMESEREKTNSME